MGTTFLLLSNGGQCLTIKKSNKHIKFLGKKHTSLASCIHCSVYIELQ